jgi:hypothetical protein
VIENIKCGRNPKLNIKDIKSEKFKGFKKDEDIENLPTPMVMMDDLDES